MPSRSARTTDKVFDLILDAGQPGAFNGMRTVPPAMRRTGGACITDIWMARGTGHPGSIDTPTPGA